MLKKNNVNTAFVENKLDESIKKLPKVSGQNPRNPSAAMQTMSYCARAIHSKHLEMNLLAPEHLVLALIQGNDNTAKLLKDAGLTEKGLISAIKESAKR